jgi:hypothetical protein
MTDKWATAQRCHAALKVLLDDLLEKSGQTPCNVNNPSAVRQPLRTDNRRKRNAHDPNAGLSKRPKTGNAHDSFDNVQGASQDPPPIPDQPYLTTESLFDDSNLIDNQLNDPQGLQGQPFSEVLPITQDLFGELSWESLFPNDNFLGGFR